jgi:hypothetical protein
VDVVEHLVADVAEAVVVEVVVDVLVVVPEARKVPRSLPLVRSFL